MNTAGRPLPRRLGALAGCVALGAAVLLPAGAADAASTGASARCGRSVAGDADGDGRSDPIVGVPGKHGEAGQAVAFHGTATGVEPLRVLRAGSDGVPGTDARNARFGTEAVYGDADGDRCSDAAVTAPDARTPGVVAGMDESGTVTVLYGSRGHGYGDGRSQLLTAAALHLPRPSIPVPTSTHTYRSLGTPVFGDFIGDGHDDLALVERVSSASPDDRRFVDIVIVPGVAGGLDLGGAQRVQLPSLRPGAGGTFEGSFLALAAGPIQQRGLDSLVVGVGGGGATGAGPASHGDVRHHPEVDVLYGGSHFPAEAAPEVWDRESTGVPGTDSGVTLDVSVAVGDFDGDGRADLAFGQPDQHVVTVVRSAGPGTGVLTAKGARSFSPGTGGLLGSAAHPGGFGRTVAAGDLNADGDDELVVGADDGSVATVPGTRASGLTTSGDLRWRQDTAGVPGTRGRHSAFGRSLQIGSFGRGSGQDLLVGDPADDEYTGSVTEFFGSTTRNAGLRKDHAALFTEATPGVPGQAVEGDVFGTRRSGWSESA